MSALKGRFKDLNLGLFFVAVTHLVAMVLGACSGISKEALTDSAMHGLEFRVRNYYALTEGLPNSLSDLPEPTGNNSDIFVDGWGSQIVYLREDLVITLISPGKDREINTEDDRIRRFELPEISENWSEDERWEAINSPNLYQLEPKNSESGKRIQPH